MEQFLFNIVCLVIAAATCPVSCWTSAQLCGSDLPWTYEPVSGKCWTLPSNVIANSTQLIAKTDGLNKCARLASNLPTPMTVDDLLGMQRFLTLNGLAADVWTAIERADVDNITDFYYSDSGIRVPTALWLNGSIPTVDLTTQTCVAYNSWVTPRGDGTWYRTMGLKPVRCSSLQATVCYKNVTQCQPTDLPSGVDLSKMTAVNIDYGATLTNLFHIGIRLDIQCKVGYYRQRDSPYVSLPTPPLTSDGLAVNQVECFPGANNDSTPIMKSATIESCLITSCPTAHLKTVVTIPNVEPYVDTLTKEYYLFGESFPVNCSQGYVSYLNQSSVNSHLICGYSSSDRTRYEWIPPDLNACQPVACPAIQTILPSYMTAYKATDRIHEKEYNEFQQSSYPYYPNRVYIKCARVGEFFEDRTFTKVLSCELNNGSLTEGAWFGALGTSLSRLGTTACVPVSCLSDQLIKKTPAGDLFLASLIYNNQTSIEFINGTSLTMATDAVNTVEFYTYGTVIRFSCLAGSSTGIGQPVVLCTDTGFWNISRLPTCVKTSEAVVAKGKHYVPPSVEAQGADSIGAIAIIVCVIFGVFIVILDLSTLSRDLVLIRRNIRRLKRRVTGHGRVATVHSAANVEAIASNLDVA